MKVINHGSYIEIIPENNYISNLEETEVYKGICGKNLNINNFKDISDEKAEEIIRRQEELDEQQEEIIDD